MRLPAPYSIVAGYDIGESGGFAINKRTGQSDILIRHYNPDEFIDWCRVFEVGVIYAENVHPYAGQGIVSSGSLMEKKGELIGIARALNIPIKWVEPLSWIQCFTLKRKKHFDSKTQWKKHLVEVAQKEVPLLVNEIDLNTADAVLLWIYGAHLSSGTPMTRKGIFA